MGAWGDAAALPPELNHTLHSMGDLGESLMQAAAGHEMLADMLIAEMTAMGLNTSTTAMVAWQGPGGVMMQMSAQEFIEVCALASMWARMSSTQAAEIVAAHSTALQAMVPAEVCLTNRTTYAALAGSNLLGQNTPAMIALDAQYYGVFWTNNATQRSAYGGVATSALGAISEPAPFSPTAADPAGPVAAVAQDAGSEAGSGAFQAGAQSMGGVADGGGMSGSMGSQFSSMIGSAVQPLTSAGQSLPSMFSQGPQMFSGLLGPLTSSLQGLNGGAAAGMVPEAAGAGLPGALGGAGALGGGGGGSLLSGTSAASSFVRPASSFSPPTTPTLPGGWQGGDKETSVQARTVGTGGGGLYGAPPGALGRESGGAESERSSRTLQVTARQGSSRGEKSRI